MDSREINEARELAAKLTHDELDDYYYKKLEGERDKLAAVLRRFLEWETRNWSHRTSGIWMPDERELRLLFLETQMALANSEAGEESHAKG